MLGKTRDLSEERFLKVAVGLDPVAVQTSSAALCSRTFYTDTYWIIFSNKTNEYRILHF